MVPRRTRESGRHTQACVSVDVAKNIVDVAVSNLNDTIFLAQCGRN
jgi:hypothetical protein